MAKFLSLGQMHGLLRNTLVDNESYQAIRNKFNERQLQIPVDYEHQTLKDMQAPAAGWIKDIVLKSDGIYGAVDWTERASEYLKNREYRYLSPVILTRSKDRKVIALHSVALTNTPAINAMTPIVNSDKPDSKEIPQEDTETSGSGTLETLLELLQLAPASTMDDVYKAVLELLEGQEGLHAYQFEISRMKADGVVLEALKEGELAPFQVVSRSNPMNPAVSHSLIAYGIATYCVRCYILAQDNVIDFPMKIRDLNQYDEVLYE